MELKNIFILLTILLKIALADDTSEDPTTSKPSACNDALRKKFEEWKLKFKIVYQSVEEENLRREIFCANSKRVQNHNGSGNATYTRSENKHTDKTPEERNNNMLGAKKPTSNKVGNRVQTTTLPQNTQRTRRSRSTRTKKTKNTVKNRFTTSPSVRNTSPAQTTRRTTIRWTTNSKPTTRTIASTSRTVPTTRSTTTRSTTSFARMTSTTRGVSRPETIRYTLNSGSPPDNVNYTQDCTPAKDQYGCGACWVDNFYNFYLNNF